MQRENKSKCIHIDTVQHFYQHSQYVKAIGAYRDHVGGGAAPGCLAVVIKLFCRLLMVITQIHTRDNI